MIDFTKHIYDNGLTLLLHQDETTPFVVVNILYKVGARNEDKNRTGFAHLFEHLMFEGTKNLAHFDHPVQSAGGMNNAFTNNDFTNYYIKLPKENLELALWLEADRMQHLAINETSLSNQKKVVVEEFKENYTNKPYGNVWHILREIVYQNHPYQWPTIGKNYKHIQDAALKDVIQFYEKYYQPDNAILSICGNINLPKAKALVSKHFSSIESKVNIKKAIPTEMEQLAARHKTVHFNVPQDAVYLVFKMPERNSQFYYVSDILSDILSSGKSSRLHHNLVTELQLFTKVDAYITGSIDSGMFVFEGRLRNNVSAEKGISAFWEEINRLKTIPIQRKELDKVKNKLLTYMAFSENELMNRAIGLCYHEMLDDASNINKEEKNYLSVKVTDIQDFVTQYFNEHQATSLYYLSNESAENPIITNHPKKSII